MTKSIDIYGHRYKWAIYIVDIFIMTAVFYVFVNYVVELAGWRNYYGDTKFYWDRFGHMFLFIASYFFSVSLIRIQPKDLDSKLETIIRAIFQVGVMYFFFALCVAILYRTFPGRLLMYSGIINTIFITLSHYLITKFVLKIRRRPENIVNVLMVGDDENNRLLSSQLGKGVSTVAYNQLGFFCPEKAEEYILNGAVDEIYCSLNPLNNKDVLTRIIKLCEERFISFYFVPNMDGYPRHQMEFTKYGDVTLISLHKEPLADVYKRVEKRAFDIVFSGVVLVMIYPVVWLIVAVGTKISSPGPVLFRQQRTGSNGKPFTMLKFRSMKVNADADKVQATEDDPRKTKFGDFLRRTSIDELPQFINVFRGDMSVVGPRPHMELHTEIYSKLVDEYLVRHLCKPGITGWAQVSGCRGETKTVEDMAERVKKDIWYIENWSLLLDLRIILKTVLNVFAGDKQAY